MDVSYVILNYNTWEDTIKEIEILKELIDVNFKDIIVVDNCSPNNSYEKLKEYSLKTGITLLYSEANKGYAAGNNIGLRYSYNNGYKYAWILNNDILIEDKDIVKKILSVFEKDEKVAVVNPDIYTPNGHLCNRNSIRGNVWDSTLGILQFVKKSRIIKDLGGYGYIYRPQGCCMMVDLKKMNDVDYMDEHTFLYVEEPILAERLLAKGYKCACITNTSVIHNHSTTVKSNIQKKKVQKIKKESNTYYMKTYRGYGKISIALCNFFMILRHELTEKH